MKKQTRRDESILRAKYEIGRKTREIVLIFFLYHAPQSAGVGNSIPGLPQLFQDARDKKRRKKKIT